MRIIRIKARVKTKKIDRKYPYMNVRAYVEDYVSYGDQIKKIDYELLGYKSLDSARSTIGRRIRLDGQPCRIRQDDGSLYLEKKSMYS